MPTWTRLVEPSASITVEGTPITPSPLRSWWKLGSSDSSALLVPTRTRRWRWRRRCRYCRYSRPCIDRCRATAGHLVPARGLFRADERPGAELTRDHRRAAIFELGSGPAADAVEVEISANLDQAGRTERLDHRGGNADHAVAIEVLVETRLQRFQRAAGSRHQSAGGVGDDVAGIVGVPDRILIAARQLQGNLVPARGLFRADEASRRRTHPRPPAYRHI